MSDAGTVLWRPDAKTIQTALVTKLAASLGIGDYDSLHRFSLERSADYWAGVQLFLGMKWLQPYRQYVDVSRGVAFPRWFVGGCLNWVNSALSHGEHPATAARTAIIAESEDGSCSAVTYAELVARVRCLAAGLRHLGIARGDRVGLLMPSGVEAVVSLVALSYLGAVAIPLFTGFGVEAVISRLSACSARGLLTANGFSRRGRWIDISGLVMLARQKLPHLQLIVAKQAKPSELGRVAVVDWDMLARTPDWASLPAEPMDPNDPFMIMYTSGTTGAPKGIVHTHGGFPLKIAHDAVVHFDLDRGDTWLWPADMGWVVGPITAIGALLRGATLVCYDGAPDYPTAGRLATLIAQHRVTHFGASPSLIRKLAAAEAAALPAGVDISSLRLLITAGEVIDTDHFVWFQRGFGRGSCPVINYTGGTEASGALLGNVIVRPIVPTAFNSGSPAVAVDVVDADGRPIVDTPGELVIRQPFVGMSKGFWNDDARYLETYWSGPADVWTHGDLAVRIGCDDPATASYLILGRSDDTLKIAGKRLGPAEVEELALQLPCVAEAAAIAVRDAGNEYKLVVFVVCTDAEQRSIAALGSDIAQQIEHCLGKPFRPARVHVVTELPRTRNFKIMRRVVRNVYCGEPQGDLSALDNPSAIEAIRRVRLAVPDATGHQ